MMIKILQNVVRTNEKMLSFIKAPFLPSCKKHTSKCNTSSVNRVAPVVSNPPTPLAMLVHGFGISSAIQQLIACN